MDLILIIHMEKKILLKIERIDFINIFLLKFTTCIRIKRNLLAGIHQHPLIHFRKYQFLSYNHHVMNVNDEYESFHFLPFPYA